ncbi:MAG: rpoN, partial [Chloroflexi bacterium]|nr:rpoN [Chloroflexota bacterium]
MERARLFIASVEQRWSTLRCIGEYLLEYQRDFFERGPAALHPLTRAQLAAELGCHESTVSRAVSEKILQTPEGRLMPLATLFDATLPVKAAIQRLLSEQPGRLSDQEIAGHLQAQGWPVARRTVAKYRSQMIVP